MRVGDQVMVGKKSGVIKLIVNNTYLVSISGHKGHNGIPFTAPDTMRWWEKKYEEVRKKKSSGELRTAVERYRYKLAKEAKKRGFEMNCEWFDERSLCT